MLPCFARNFEFFVFSSNNLETFVVLLKMIFFKLYFLITFPPSPDSFQILRSSPPTQVYALLSVSLINKQQKNKNQGACAYTFIKA